MTSSTLYSRRGRRTEPLMPLESVVSILRFAIELLIESRTMRRAYSRIYPFLD